MFILEKIIWNNILILIYITIDTDIHKYMIFYWQVYVILISSRNWHFDMIHITWERNETSAFVSFQELQASDSGLLFTLSTESSLDMFVLNLCPFKNFGGGHARRAPDLRLWTGGRPVGPWGLWVNLRGLRLAATKPLWQISRRGGGGAGAAWRTTEAKRPGAMHSSARSTFTLFAPLLSGHWLYYHFYYQSPTTNTILQLSLHYRWICW